MHLGLSTVPGAESTSPALQGGGEQPLTQAGKGGTAAAQETAIFFPSTQPCLSHSSPAMIAALGLPVMSPVSSLT